jgi:hypothetical protein
MVEHTEEKALLAKLQHEVDRLRLSLRLAGQPLLYNLAKLNPLNDEEDRLCRDCPLEILKDAIAKYAEIFDAAKPTCWRVKISENSQTAYEPDSHYLVVESSRDRKICSSVSPIRGDVLWTEPLSCGHRYQLRCPHPSA